MPHHGASAAPAPLLRMQCLLQAALMAGHAVPSCVNPLRLQKKKQRALPAGSSSGGRGSASKAKKVKR